ncbi:MAG TPA: response regulator transcription factor [Dehalococcoidia bacterium]|nr:response regulator transcription factor [Dehalococcoidia bacterium]
MAEIAKSLTSRSPSLATTTPGRRTEPVVLVADDDPGIRAVVAQLLQINGFFAVTCADGESALELARKLRPALVILDVRMPALDGLTVCQTIRRGSDTPIIMLTVLNDEAEAAKALDAGADDYIRKPFGARELVSRVKAVVRRAGNRGLGDRVSAGSLQLDENQRIVLIHGVEVHVSSTEFDLLAYLARNANRVVTHVQLLDHIWGYDYTESRQAIRLVIHRLRRKLESATGIQLETMSGVGYRLKIPDLDPDAVAAG